MASYQSADDAESAFYAAFSNSSFEDMMQIWAPNESIVCIHPLGPRLEGRQLIASSWRQILSNEVPHQFEPRLRMRQSNRGFAIHIVDELISIPGSQVPIKPVIATNAYQLIDGAWFMVLHHASIDARDEPTMQAEMSDTRH